MMRALLQRVGRVGLAAALLAPLGVFVLSALSLRWFYPQPFPTEWTTTTLQRALNDPRVIAGARDGLTIAVAVTALSLAIGYPAARTLGLRRFAGRQAAWILLFLPTVVPPLAIGMGLNIAFLRVGLAGSWTCKTSKPSSRTARMRRSWAEGSGAIGATEPLAAVGMLLPSGVTHPSGGGPSDGARTLAM